MAGIKVVLFPFIALWFCKQLEKYDSKLSKNMDEGMNLGTFTHKYSDF